jgi:hypothetical protein
MNSQEKIRLGESAPKVTRLIIEKENLKAKGADNGVVGEMRRLRIGRNTPEDYDFYSISNLSRTQKLEVFMRAEDGLKQIRVPEHILERMSEYLRRPQEYGPSDRNCREFVHFVHEVPFDRKMFQPDQWDWFQLADESHLRSGDSICITKSLISAPKTFADVELQHFAIYLDADLYISKVGAGGDLVVSDLNTMKRIYEGDGVFLMLPKADSAENEQSPVA